jgi:hypothetical protein
MIITATKEPRTTSHRKSGKEQITIVGDGKGTNNLLG